MSKFLFGFMLIFSATAFAHKGTELKFQPLAKAHAPKFLLADKKKMDADAKKLGAGETETSVAWVHLNRDHKKDFCVSYSGGSLGHTSNIQCFIATNKKDFRKVIDVIASPEFVSLPGTKTKGYADLIFSGKGFEARRVWKWNGKEYR